MEYVSSSPCAQEPATCPRRGHVNPGEALPFHFFMFSSNVILPSASTSYRRSFRNLSPKLFVLYWCLGEASGDGQRHSRMWGKDCPRRLMHHVWCPPPIYTCNVVYRIGKDRRGEGKAASGVGTRGYWQRPNTMALPSREAATIYNTSHLANV